MQQDRTEPHEAGTGDRRVIACNFCRSHSAIRKGALAYVYMPNPGSGYERMWMLVRSRSGRWIEQWEAIKHLDNFRAKTIPPEHPLHKDERLWDLSAGEMAAIMQQRAEEARSRSRATECIVAGCTNLGIDRIVGEDKARNSTARAVLCEDHEHVFGAPGET